MKRSKLQRKLFIRVMLWLTIGISNIVFKSRFCTKLECMYIIFSRYNIICIRYVLHTEIIFTLNLDLIWIVIQWLDGLSLNTDKIFLCVGTSVLQLTLLSTDGDFRIRGVVSYTCIICKSNSRSKLYNYFNRK